MKRWLIVLCACAAHHPPAKFVDRDREPPPMQEPLEQPVTFGPLSGEATAWNQPLPGEPPPPVADNLYVDPTPRTPDDELFVALQIFARGRGVLTRDHRLDRAATELATVVPQGVDLSEGLVEFALHAHGIVEPAAKVAVMRGSREELAAELGELLFFGNVQLGIGGEPTVVIVTYRSFATILSAPRFVPSHGRFELDAKLDAKHRDPRITVTHDDGSVEHPRVTVAGDRLRATIECRGNTREQWLDIEAGDEASPLALVPIACGVTPETTFRVEPSVNLQATAVEQRLASIINRERVAAHLEPLVTDPRATLAAHRYAETMRKNHSVSHELDHLPADRLRAVGLVPPLLLESTMTVKGIGRASELLVNPGVYHKDMVSPLVTHLGIGIVENAEHEQFVTILYLQIPKPIDPVRVQQTIIANIRAIDVNTHMIALDGELEQAAMRFARELAAGWRPDQIWIDLHGVLSFAALRYHKVDRTLTQLIDLEKLDGKQFIQGNHIKGMGVGVAQSVRSGPLGGRIWVIVIFGT